MIGSTGTGWQVARWGAAGAVAIAAHFGGAWVAMNWGAHATPQGDPPAAVMIELAPLPVSASDSPQSEIAPGPQVAEAQAADKPVESKVAENEPPPPEPEPEPVPEPEIKVPEVQQKAEVVLPAVPKVDPQKEREKKRKLERERQKRVELERERKIEREKERVARANAKEAQKDAVAQRTSAPSGAPGPRSPSAASASAGANSAAMSSWRGAVMSHLNRHKRFPDSASAGGTVTVSFSINRNGSVTGARLARSSGADALDSEAVATVRRASPVPAPPAHIAGSTITLTVPIRYSR